MVIGPTPPGTGVMKPATEAASEKSTSPTLPFAVTRVDDHGPRFDPVALHKAWPPHRRHHNVCRANDRGKVLRARVAVGDRGVSAEKEHPDRLSKNRAPTNHDAMLSRGIDVIRLEQAHDATGGARSEPGKPESHRSEGVRGDPVDIFGRSNRFESRPLVNRLGNRMLEENPVDLPVGGEFLNGCDELFGCHGLGELDAPRMRYRRRRSVPASF